MNINWKGKVAVGVGIAVIVTILNQAPHLIADLFKSNAWDTEVQEAIAPVKRVVEPLARSVQSLAIDRKISVRDRKVEIAEKVAAVPVASRTSDQQLIFDDAAEGIKKLDKEIAQLEEEYKLPIFEEIGAK